MSVEEIKRVGDGSTGEVYSHPAMGMISAHRVQGTTNALWMSEVKHLGYVVLEIDEATLHKDAYADRTFPGKRVVRVAMTEAQWVGLISRMNTTGVPCTLRERHVGEYVDLPELPSQDSGEAKLDSMKAAMAARLKQQIDERADVIRTLGGKLGKKDKEELDKQLSILIGHLHANAAYAEERLTEVKEKMVNDAKTEIEAHVQGVVHRLGIQSLHQLTSAAGSAPGETPRLPDGNRE